MPNMEILVGISGSGKSTYAKRCKNSLVCSADDFFIDKNGVYQFDANKLAQAHGACLRKVIRESVEPEGDRNIVIDNTNLSIAEIAPYAAIANAYGYDLTIVVFTCDFTLAASRNVHGCSRSVIFAQAEKLRIVAQELRRSLWKKSVFFEKGVSNG